jgi:hypothetical protein
MAVWEYRVVDLTDLGVHVGPKEIAVEETGLLNSFGKDGWELVSVTETISTGGSSSNHFHKAYFKKEMK